MTEWKPIETAPKDERVLVFDKYVGVVSADYGEHFKYRFAPGWYPAESYFGEEGQPILLNPSHWMPLPDEPPQSITAPPASSPPPLTAT